MKKLCIFMALSVAFTVFCYSTPAPILANTVTIASKTNTTKTAVKPGFSKNDLKIQVGSKQYGLLSDAKVIVKAVKGDWETQETISCAYKGMDKLFTHETLIISTVPIDKKDAVDEIIVTGGTHKSTKGIKIGDTKKQVEAVYGKGYTMEDDMMTYWSGEKNGAKTPRLYFVITDGKVEMFGIYGGKNAG